MQEQNFEKQVQQKMDELSFTPSAPVWQNVEKEIRQKKKRRRILFFWLFPLLLGGGLLWITFSNDAILNTLFQSKPTIATAPSTRKSIENQNSNKPFSKQTENPITAKETPSTTSPNQTKRSPTIKNGTSEKIAFRNSTQSTTNNISKNYKPALVKKNTIPPKNTIGNTKPDVSPLQPELALTDNLIKDKKVWQDTTTINQIAEASNNETTTTIENNSSQQQVTKQEIKEPTTDSSQAKEQRTNINKWSWAIQGAFGISTAQTQLLERAGQVEMFFRGNAITTTATTTTPSKLQNSYAYSLGALVKRTLNKRLALTTGLNYTYFSTKNVVGKPANRDTVVQFADRRAAISQYYRRGATTEYKNNYHFLELPIGVEWQLHRRLPLHFQTGVSLAYLFSTNALMYDPNSGIHYQSKELFASTQVHMNTALTYRIWHQNTKGIHIGPFMQYGISDLQKQKQKDNYHLFAAGLRAQFSF